LLIYTRIFVLAGPSTVSCRYQEPHICGYTTGSCWNRDIFSHANYGKQRTTVNTFIFCVT